ncbi:SDR family oxidoreductase [Amycolatopsis ultiminotia]|uniref:SDR family oxidoreductase n=1 Tax=Amycolatopsis ultiminotia TaxID=543629 RepID=A0ABP6XYW6_9PSEU
MPRQPRSLEGKVVVITGGAQGIGAATATVLHRLGARVALGDLDRVRVEKTAGELGPEVLGLPLDVTDTDAFTAFLDEIERRLGPIDVLINNAGIMPLALLEEEDDATTRRVLELNLHAVVHGTRQAMRRMKPRRSGHIVNVASMAGKSGFPGAATYCASKHAVVGLSEAVHLELRGSGVDVSCVMPGVVRTEMASGLGEARLFKSVTPEEVAGAIAAALRYPKFDVFVPKALDFTGRITRLFPRAVSEWFVRVLGGDQLLASAVHSPERTEYESRAARSAPAAEHRE